MRPHTKLALTPPSFGKLPIFDIYNKVRATGMPNMLEARIPVPSLLNIDVGRAIVTGRPDDKLVIDGLTYGFPLQFIGPKLDCDNKAAYSSAIQYMPHVHAYIKKE